MTMTHHDHQIRNQLQKLIKSTRAGIRADGLSEKDVIAFWMYHLEKCALGAHVLEINRVTTREDITRVTAKVRAALKQMREAEPTHSGRST